MKDNLVDLALQFDRLNQKLLTKPSYKGLTPEQIKAELQTVRGYLLLVMPTVRSMEGSLKDLQNMQQELIERKWKLEAMTVPVLKVVPKKLGRKQVVADEDIKSLLDLSPEALEALRKEVVLGRK